MKNLDEIYEYVNDVTTILVINNTSKLLLDSLYNSIYNKYSASKCKCNTRNHLMRKFSVIKSKLIRVDFDLKNAQFSSSTANSKTTEDFKLLKSYLIENNSKILFKTDLSYLGETHTKILEILKEEQVIKTLYTPKINLLVDKNLKNKDEYTYMHSVAVCALMVALAKELGLSESEIRQAGLAGLLHDIGKAGIPSDVLNKPGALTDEEFS